MSQRFPKAEKLKSRKTIKQLFEEGKSFTKFPIKVLYIPSENKVATQAAFAVPKRNFKLAVSRNRIKRQLREAYRLNKQDLLINNSTKFALLFLYLGKDNVAYDKIDKAMISLLKKLQDETT